jgi:hypothetical protein
MNINAESVYRKLALNPKAPQHSRISEVLALRWESLNFDAGTMLVERAVVNGHIGPTRLKHRKMTFLWMVS